VSTGAPGFSGVSARVHNSAYNQIDLESGLPYRCSMLRAGWITDKLPPDPMHTFNGIIKAVVNSFLLSLKLYKKMPYKDAIDYIDSQMQDHKWKDILTSGGDRLRQFSGTIENLKWYTHMEIAHLFTKFVFTVCRYENISQLFPREESIAFEKATVGLYLLMTLINSQHVRWTSSLLDWLHSKTVRIGNDLKAAFKELGEDFNLPKVHNIRHILEFVEILSRPREFDTPLFEHEHIKTKKLFKITNRRTNRVSSGVILETTMMRKAMVRQTVCSVYLAVKTLREEEDEMISNRMLGNSSSSAEP
jgi:hypothetical protein